MRFTALNQEHKKLKARMVNYFGWEMPVSYQGINAEHLSVRASAGVFDVSHMGQLLISGPEALEFLQAVSTNDVSRLVPGKMQYSLLADESGSILDDVILGRLEEEQSYFMVVNAANSENDFEWLKSNVGKFKVNLQNLEKKSMLALQGPRSAEILRGILKKDPDTLGYYCLRKDFFQNEEILLARSGYTGEDGFEISLSPLVAVNFWRLMLEQGAEPVGLGARNTLRLEMGYSLYGHEIERNTNPWEVGLGWVVRLEKPEFLAKKVLSEKKQIPLKRQLVGFFMIDKAVARDGYKVKDSRGKGGVVTSGAPSPSSGKNIGLAYVDSESAVLNRQIEIEIRGQWFKAKIISVPFVPSKVKKNIS
jgi:aminomethyltransferase